MKSLRLDQEDELRSASDAEPAMLITTMIDVIFMMLAFFVCVSEVRRSALTVDLPAVTTAQADAAPVSSGKPIVVEVGAQDEVFVGGVAAPDDAAIDRLIAESVARHGKDAPVHLSGDRQAKNGTMMRVVGRLSQAGLTRIEFEVDAAPARAGG